MWPLTYDSVDWPFLAFCPSGDAAEAGMILEPAVRSMMCTSGICYCCDNVTSSSFYLVSDGEDSWWTMSWKECGRRRLCRKSRYCPDIYLLRLSRTTKCLFQNKWSPDWNLRPRSLERETEVLTIWIRNSVTWKFVINAERRRRSWPTRTLTHWGRVTQICVFNTRLFSLHNTLNL